MQQPPAGRTCAACILRAVQPRSIALGGPRLCCHIAASAAVGQYICQIERGVGSCRKGRLDSAKARPPGLSQQLELLQDGGDAKLSLAGATHVVVEGGDSGGVVTIAVLDLIHGLAGCAAVAQRGRR